MPAEMSQLEAQSLRSLAQASGAAVAARDLDSLVSEVLTAAVRPGVATASAFVLEGNSRACAWVKRAGAPSHSSETFAGTRLQAVGRLFPGTPCVLESAPFREMFQLPPTVGPQCVAMASRDRQGAKTSLFLFFPDRDIPLDSGRILAQVLSDVIEMGRERLRMLARVEHIATRDDVTTAFNFRFLKTALKKELSRAARRGEPLSVIMLDVDRLKEFNDRFGHSVGSRLLQELARVLAAGVRESDWVAKYGGDEFLILLPSSGKEAAIAVGERLRSMVRNHTFEHAAPGEVTASFGVAGFPEDGDRPRSLIQAADQALYRAKHEGRDRLCVAGA